MRQINATKVGKQSGEGTLNVSSMKGIWMMSTRVSHRVTAASLITLLVILGVRSAEAKLVAYWPFDTHLTDRVADAKAKLVGEVTFVPGYIGKALELRGDSAYIELPIGSLLGSLTDCSIALWINSTEESGYWTRVFDFGSGTSASMYLTSRSRFRESMYFQITNQGYDKGADMLPLYRLPSGWHHIVVTIDADAKKVAIYADGDFLGENKASLTPKDLGNIETAWLGKSHHRLDPYFKGMLDEVAVFDLALEEREVRTLYRSSAEAFLQGKGPTVAQGFKKAYAMMEHGQAGRAVSVLQGIIAKQKQLEQGTAQGPSARADAVLAESWSRIGTAREVAKAPALAIAEAYTRSALLAAKGDTCVNSLLGVFRHSAMDVYSAAVQKSFERSTVSDAHLSILTESFRTSGKWQAFSLFLDVLFSEVEDPASHAITIGQLLSGTAWSARFDQYCQSVAKESPFNIATANTFAEMFCDSGEFEQAMRVYKDLSEQLTDPKEKARCEVKLCRTLFLNGHYDEAEALADRLIEANDADVVDGPLLLKGQILISKDQLEEANKTFGMVVNSSNNSDQRSSALYLLGYCRFLQKDLVNSRKVLLQLQETYPDSVFARKAGMLAGSFESKSK